MNKKSLSWAIIIVMTLSLFTVTPIKAEAGTVIKNICDADVLPGGNIAVLYTSEDKVYYGELDPETNSWSKREIASGKDAALALDASGKPHIAYIKTNDDLAYTYFNGSSWSSPKTIDSVNFSDVQGVLSYPDIVIDQSGNAHITYMDSKAGYNAGNDYTSYDKDDVMYAVNSGGTSEFVKQVRSYSHGWFYSPDGWRNWAIAPPKITFANGQYCIGIKQYSYDKSMSTQYHTYSFDLLFPTTNTPNSIGYLIRSATTNSDLGFQLYSVDTDGTNVISLFKKSESLYITNGTSEIASATKAFTCVAADLFVNSSAKYYAAINSSSLLLYQNGSFKESLSLPMAISSTNYRMATVVSGQKQYVLYTDTSGDLWACGVSTEAANTDMSTFKIPDKAPVTIAGISVASKTYDGNAISYTGTASATVTETGVAETISSYDYTWYDVTNSSTLTQAPKTVGSYKLIVSVPESNTTYSGALEIPFSITQKAITISGVTATNRSYNGLVAVSISGGTLLGIESGDTVSANVPSNGTIANANVENYKEVTLANITLSGAEAPNYTLTQPTGITVNITKANLTLNTVTIDSKAYDGTTTVNVSNVTFNGLQNSETLAMNTDFTVSSEYENETAGTNKTVTGTISLSSTAKANNYNLASGEYTTSGNITKASGLVALNPADIKVYKNMAKEYSFDLSSIGLNKTDVGSFSYGLGTLSGSEIFSVNPVISPDGRMLLFTSADVSSGNATQIITLSTQNYENANATLTFVTVDKEPITITGISIASKIYDGNAITYTGTPSATVTDTGDTVAISAYNYTWYDVTNSTALTQAPKNVGNYKLVVFVSDANTIYTGVLEIPFSILKKDLTIKPANKNIYKNAALPTPEIEYVGLVAGEVGSEVISFSENLTMEIQDASGNQLVDSRTKGNYPIVFTNSPIITSANYNITTNQGVLKIEKTPVVMSYNTEDSTTGIKGSGLESNVVVPEKNQEDVEEITLSIQAMNAIGNQSYNEIFKSSEESLKKNGYILLKAFDLKIFKNIKSTDGTITKVRVSNEDITGFITVDLPIPEDLEWEGDIGIAYIDEEGNVQKISSSKVCIDGKYYLEFQTDHFSIYAIVEINDTATPKTGETDPISYYFAGMLLLGAGVLLIAKRKFNYK